MVRTLVKLTLFRQFYIMVRRWWSKQHVVPASCTCLRLVWLLVRTPPLALSDPLPLAFLAASTIAVQIHI